MKTLCIEKFFPPSLELTQSVMERIREHSVRDIRSSIESVERLESSDDDELWSELLKTYEEEHPTLRASEPASAEKALPGTAIGNSPSCSAGTGNLLSPNRSG